MQPEEVDCHGVAFVTGGCSLSPLLCLSVMEDWGVRIRIAPPRLSSNPPVFGIAFRGFNGIVAIDLSAVLIAAGSFF